MRGNRAAMTTFPPSPAPDGGRPVGGRWPRAKSRHIGSVPRASARRTWEGASPAKRGIGRVEE